MFSVWLTRLKVRKQKGVFFSEHSVNCFATAGLNDIVFTIYSPSNPRHLVPCTLDNEGMILFFLTSDMNLINATLLLVRFLIICPIAIAYSMRQTIKSFCVSVSVYLCVRECALSRSHFWIDFHPNWHRRKTPLAMGQIAYYVPQNVLLVGTHLGEVCERR